MPRLSIHLPDGSEKTIVLPKNGEYFARIGRDEHCEIVLPFQSVSGEHALLQFKEGDMSWRTLVLLMELKSTA